MNSFDRDSQAVRHSFRTTLAILGVALAGVALLFALGRMNWLQLRPASGTAAAMYQATTIDKDGPAHPASVSSTAR
jgi:type IV secretory pathway VirB2 component (pilin)